LHAWRKSPRQPPAEQNSREGRAQLRGANGGQCRLARSRWAVAGAGDFQSGERPEGLQRLLRRDGQNREGRLLGGRGREEQDSVLTAPDTCARERRYAGESARDRSLS